MVFGVAEVLADGPVGVNVKSNLEVMVVKNGFRLQDGIFDEIDANISCLQLSPSSAQAFCR